VPAFTGYPVNLFKAEIISGIRWSWAVYFLTANLFAMLIIGGKYFSYILSIGSLIALPVVFAGASVSYVLFLSSMGPGPSSYSPHYVMLSITILTVVPLALSMVTLVPFHEFEQKLMKNKHGVSMFEKCILICLRVFNHIIYFVIPNILEVVREEAQYMRWAKQPDNTLISRFKCLIKDMTQIGIEGICASIQYIPLWAVEIAQLPDKNRDQARESGDRK
jgi:hypothetical protein